MEIETGIPIPVKNWSGSEFTRTIRALKVGESVLVDTDTKRDHARKIIKSLGGMYATRKMDGGWRIWRTA